jgi:hypothetical protein
VEQGLADLTVGVESVRASPGCASSDGSASPMGVAAPTAGLQKPARIRSGSLQSLTMPPDPLTRTRRLASSPDDNGSNGQGTRTESSPTTAVSTSLPRRSSSSARSWVHGATVVWTRQLSGGRAVATNSVPRGEWAVRLTTVGTGIGLRLLRYSSKVSIVLDGVTC